MDGGAAPSTRLSSLHTSHTVTHRYRCCPLLDSHRYTRHAPLHNVTRRYTPLQVRPHLLDEGFDQLFECVQEPGDLLFVPSGWHHSVLNTRLSVSLAVQIGAPLSWGEYFG